MKKFLSVLLALAVAFTFTFGSCMSAFAATDESTFNGNVNAAQEQVVETLNTSYNNVVKALADEVVDLGDNDVTITKAAWTTGAATIKTKQETAITARTNEIKGMYSDSTVQDMTVIQLVGLYSEAAGGAHSFVGAAPITEQTALYTALTTDTDVKTAAAKAQFTADKAAALAAVNSVDLTIYSTTTPKTGETYNAQAKKIVDKAVTDINNIAIAATASLGDVDAAYTALGTFAAGTINTTTNVVTTGVAGSAALGTIRELVDSADSTKVVKYVLVSSIKTIAEESADATTETAKKASYVSQVNANAADYLAANATAAADVLAKVQAEKEIYVAAMTEIINACDAVSTDIAATAGAIAKPDNTNFYYTANKAKIDELIAVANKYKAYKDANGNLVKDAKAIDDVVAAAKLAAYKVNAPWGGLEAAKTAITSGCNAVTIDSATVAQEKADIENGRKAALDNSGEDKYYAPEAEKVNKLFDELLTKVDAAKTTAEVTAVYTDNAHVTGLADIKTKAQVVAAIKGFTAFGTNQSKLSAYVTAINTGVTPDEVKNVDLSDDTQADFYATKGARTNDEVAALYNDAKAAADATKTVGAIKEDKKATEATIAALPSTITAADAAAVEAAFEAITAYNKEAGKNMGNTDIANVATLTLAIKALYTAEKKVITDKYAALPTTVVAADKAMYKALAADIDAFNAKTETGKIYGGMADLSSEATAIAGKLATIRGLDKAAVLAAIDALPLNITYDNKAAVEAARAAYDAYVAEYTDLTQAAPVGFQKNAAADFTDAQFKVLADAEATIEALAPKYTDTDAKADMFDMTYTLTKKKVTSKKYKVTAKAGAEQLATLKDNGYTVKYRFYKKAPKKTSYKLMKTTTTKYYSYAKLTKGKNYFKVKMTVYKADGTVLGSKTKTTSVTIK